jgi:hypothetical protein
MSTQSKEKHIINISQGLSFLTIIRAKFILVTEPKVLINPQDTAYRKGISNVFKILDSKK